MRRPARRSRSLAAVAVAVAVAACAHGPARRPADVVVRGRVISVFVTGTGAVMTIDRGSDAGVARGWIARFVSLRSRPEGPVISVTRSKSVVQVTATFDSIPAGLDVELRPPPR